MGSFRRLFISLLAIIGLLTLVGMAALAVALQPWRLPPAPKSARQSRPDRHLMSAAEGSCEERYLELLKRYLVRYDFGTTYRPVNIQTSMSRRVAGRLLAARGLLLARIMPESSAARETGDDWPATAETMIGLQRLDNLQQCTIDVLKRKVPGDLIECRAWRGGATIFMRAVLQSYGVKDRNVWVADSFQGLPKPYDQKYPADKGIDLWHNGESESEL